MTCSSKKLSHQIHTFQSPTFAPFAARICSRRAASGAEKSSPVSCSGSGSAFVIDGTQNGFPVAA
ncbi:MAG: hypothetical protein J6J38_04560 [Lachnospiraceae bacterium]|nr:hypothetical protein [Lachnospiraceae bacterium]